MGKLAAALPRLFLADMKRGHGLLWDQLYISYDDDGFTYSHESISYASSLKNTLQHVLTTICSFSMC